MRRSFELAGPRPRSHPSLPSSTLLLLCCSALLVEPAFGARAGSFSASLGPPTKAGEEAAAKRPLGRDGEPPKDTAPALSAALDVGLVGAAAGGYLKRGRAPEDSAGEGEAQTELFVANESDEAILRPSKKAATQRDVLGRSLNMDKVSAIDGLMTLQDQSTGSLAKEIADSLRGYIYRPGRFNLEVVVNQFGHGDGWLARGSISLLEHASQLMPFRHFSRAGVLEAVEQLATLAFRGLGAALDSEPLDDWTLMQMSYSWENLLSYHPQEWADRLVSHLRRALAAEPSPAHLLIKLLDLALGSDRILPHAKEEVLRQLVVCLLDSKDGEKRERLSNLLLKHLHTKHPDIAKSLRRAASFVGDLSRGINAVDQAHLEYFAKGSSSQSAAIYARIMALVNTSADAGEAA